MSTKTLRKRISLVAVTALTAGVLSVVAAPVANANIVASTNAVATVSSLNVAVGSNATGSATQDITPVTDARSLGLLYKDASSTTAQTANMLASGTLVLYTLSHATSATNVGFTASGGSFGTTIVDDTAAAVATAVFGADLKSMVVSSGTAIAVTWTPGGTAGSYTISSYLSGAATNIEGLTTITSGTLFGNISVTASAASAGGSISIANSTCVTDNESGALTSTADDTNTVTDGSAWYIKYILRDAYLSENSTSGNLVVTATNGALLSIGAGAQAAGTASTVVAYGTGATGSAFDAVRVNQPTAGAPLTTTVTIQFHGVTVYTKTVTIRGAADKIVIASVGTGDIGTGSTNGVGTVSQINDGTNRAGLYTVTLLDSAGNIATPSANTEFSADAASLTTTITALAVASASIATSVSSTSPWAYSVGTFTCGPTAGSSKVKLKHTSASTGKIITAEFTPRCADDSYTYTASFDKAAYSQGEIATLTVKFLDSKGNAANNAVAVGASQIILPMMTFVSATGAATSIPKADGSIEYTLTVGTTTGMTAGTYTGIVDFTALTAVAATKSTPTYKLSTGGDTTTNADVLKSIVALIASINKQIQALQKLILKR